jgi:hypothetical protein
MVRKENKFLIHKSQRKKKETLILSQVLTKKSTLD